MNLSIKPTTNILSNQIVQKKNNGLSNDLSSEIENLCYSINNICHQPSISLDEVFKSSNSNLEKLYKLFLSLKDKKNNLLNSNVFNDLIIKKTKDLSIQFNQINKYPMNFFQFIKQIEILAKENQLNKEYIYKKILYQTSINNNENQNNNAFISNNFLLNEYNHDLSNLKIYFIRHCKKLEDQFSHQMSCSIFIKCISYDLKLNQIDDYFQLNDIFNKIYSLFVNQGIYIPASHTIDFHGFILCLQQISQIFHFNLRKLIKNLINSIK